MGTCLLIDIGKPDDSNTNKKESAKLSNYKDLEMEISRLESEDKNCASYTWSIRNN
jgi:hypothetical protein